MAPQRLGLFGGTFDPPHIGHLILASEAAHDLRLQRVLWMPAPKPPHKTDEVITDIQHRLAMLRAATAKDPLFEVSALELERPGPHYTVDTLQQLSATSTDQALVLLIGEDSLRELPAWHEPSRLIALCDSIGVMRRTAQPMDLAPLEEALPGISAKLRILQAPLLEIASSEIRRRAAAQLPYKYFVPAGVHEYIMLHSLYSVPGPLPHRA